MSRVQGQQLFQSPNGKPNRLSIAYQIAFRHMIVVLDPEMEMFSSCSSTFMLFQAERHLMYIGGKYMQGMAALTWKI